MKTTTKEILRAVWERNADLCDVMAYSIERQEGWDKVDATWGGDLTVDDWKTFLGAYRAEWG